MEFSNAAPGRGALGGRCGLGSVLGSPQFWGLCDFRIGFGVSGFAIAAVLRSPRFWDRFWGPCGFRIGFLSVLGLWSFGVPVVSGSLRF